MFFGGPGYEMPGKIDEYYDWASILENPDAALAAVISAPLVEGFEFAWQEVTGYASIFCLAVSSDCFRHLDHLAALAFIPERAYQLKYFLELLWIRQKF